MLRIGDWLQIGDSVGAIQAWGEEVGFSRTGGHPVKKTSRRKALASKMPMVLLWIRGRDEEVWYPLEACKSVPPPMG